MDYILWQKIDSKWLIYGILFDRERTVILHEQYRVVNRELDDFRWVFLHEWYDTILVLKVGWPIFRISQFISEYVTVFKMLSRILRVKRKKLKKYGIIK